MKTKKMLSMLIAIVMIFSVAMVPAFASSGEPAQGDETPAAEFDHNIDFGSIPSANDYKIFGNVTQKDSSGGSADLVKFTQAIKDAIYIDILEEKLYVTLPDDTFSIAAYSVEGGATSDKWKAKSIGSPEGEDISKLLNKGLTLTLTTKYDKKAKGPAAGVAAQAGTDTTDEVKAEEAAIVITFDTIKPRPKADKVAVNYYVYRDESGKTDGQWTLTDKGTDTVKVTGLQVALASADKKNPEKIGNNTWGNFKSDAGINVKPLGEDGKVQKTVYLVRKAPVLGTNNWEPASKVFKITASGAGKAMKQKADYKTEVVKAKTNMWYYYGSVKELEAGSADNPAPTYIKADAKDAAKAGIDISKYLDEKRMPITLWTEATQKKPATAKQEISLAARAYLNNYEYAPAKGKIKLLKDAGQAHEVIKDATKNKWGNLPKIEKSQSIDVRVKPTAKGGKEDDATFAASRTGSLEITYDIYNKGEKKEKKGITAAEVVAYDYKGVPVARFDKDATEKITYKDTGKKIVFRLYGFVAPADFVTAEAEGKVLVTPKYDEDLLDVKSTAIGTEKKTDDKGREYVEVTLTVDAIAAGSGEVELEFDTSKAEAYQKGSPYSAKPVIEVAPIEITLGAPSVPSINLDAGKSTTVDFTFDAALAALVASGDIYLTDDGREELEKIEYVAGTKDGKPIITATIKGKTATTGADNKITFTLNVKDPNYAASETTQTVGYTVKAAEYKSSVDVSKEILKAVNTSISESDNDPSKYDTAEKAYQSGETPLSELTVQTHAKAQIKIAAQSVADKYTLGSNGKLEVSTGNAAANDTVTIEYKVTGEKTDGSADTTITFYVLYKIVTE